MVKVLFAKTSTLFVQYQMAVGLCCRYLTFVIMSNTNTIYDGKSVFFHEEDSHREYPLVIIGSL